MDLKKLTKAELISKLEKTNKIKMKNRQQIQLHLLILSLKLKFDFYLLL